MSNYSFKVTSEELWTAIYTTGLKQSKLHQSKYKAVCLSKCSFSFDPPLSPICSMGHNWYLKHHNWTMDGHLTTTRSGLKKKKKHTTLQCIKGGNTDEQRNQVYNVKSADRQQCWIASEKKLFGQSLKGAMMKYLLSWKVCVSKCVCVRACVFLSVSYGFGAS